MARAFTVNSCSVFTVPDLLYMYAPNIAFLVLTGNALWPDVSLPLLINHFLSPPKKPSSSSPRAIRATAAYTRSKYSEREITGGMRRRSPKYVPMSKKALAITA